MTLSPLFSEYPSNPTNSSTRKLQTIDKCSPYESRDKSMVINQLCSITFATTAAEIRARCSIIISIVRSTKVTSKAVVPAAEVKKRKWKKALCVLDGTINLYFIQSFPVPNFAVFFCSSFFVSLFFHYIARRIKHTRSSYLHAATTTAAAAFVVAFSLQFFDINQPTAQTKQNYATLLVPLLVLLVPFTTTHTRNQPTCPSSSQNRQPIT